MDNEIEFRRESQQLRRRAFFPWDRSFWLMIGFSALAGAIEVTALGIG